MCCGDEVPVLAALQGPVAAGSRAAGTSIEGSITNLVDDLDTDMNSS
jgi:hypothetical protein